MTTSAHHTLECIQEFLNTIDEDLAGEGRRITEEDIKPLYMVSYVLHGLLAPYWAEIEKTKPVQPKTFTQQIQAIRHDGSTRTGSAIIDWAEQHGESNLYFRCDEGEGCRSESHELRVANPGGAEYLCPPGWWVVLDNDECVYFLDPDYMDNNWTEEEG